MIAKKYVLLVDATGALSARVEELKELGYDVAQVSSLRTALNAVAALDRLSLVVINCTSDGADYANFMASVRALHPQLPVIWLGDSRQILSSFLKQPATSARRSDHEALLGSAAKLLHDEFYANDLVKDTVAAAEHVLGEFGLDPNRSEPYIKSNLTVLGEVNALIGFSGEGLSGHLILTASAEKARAIQQRLLPGSDPQFDELEDLVGEITNRVLGRIKRSFEARSLSFKLKAPAFIRGPSARYHNKSLGPSLAIEFTDDASLRLELCLDRMEAVQPVSADAAFLESGEINFL
jgi:CheY-specific phosphatase CheX